MVSDVHLVPLVHLLKTQKPSRSAGQKPKSDHAGPILCVHSATLGCRSLGEGCSATPSVLRSLGEVGCVKNITGPTLSPSLSPAVPRRTVVSKNIQPRPSFPLFPLFPSVKNHPTPSFANFAAFCSKNTTPSTQLSKTTPVRHSVALRDLCDSALKISPVRLLLPPYLPWPTKPGPSLLFQIESKPHFPQIV